MKKISLKKINFKEVQQLSREQLKNVLGGFMMGSGGSGGSGSGSGCPASCAKYNLSGGPQFGTCHSRTIWGSGGATMTICECSVVGGTGC